MKDGKAERAIRDRIDAATEAPVQDDQPDIEAAFLATLAVNINSDSELKYDLLDIDAADFYFRENRETFAAMKALSAAGDHVDQLTIQAKGASWPDITKAKAEAATTYKRQIIARATKRHAAGIGREYLEAVDGADPDDLPGLVAGLQAVVNDIDRTKRFMPTARTEADLIDAFIQDLTNPTPGYRTGFRHLDAVIGEGLKPGVFVIAAPPSAGKTTFIKQMADQVAEFNDGVPVLFFSYEQSAAELRRKTLARLSKQDNQLIREGTVREADLADAVDKIRDFGRRLKIIEADFHHNVGMIRLLAQREKHQTGKAPVIFVDYLQVMPAADPKLKDKRAEVDSLVSELRRLARDIDAPVIIISSMARSAYTDAKISGFKESGGIEYGTDIAAIMDVQDEMKDGTERTIDLVIVKNRNGRRRVIELNYKMKFDTFADGPSGRTYSYQDALGKDKRK